MRHIVTFLLQYGYFVLAAVVFAEQLGLPLPAAPVLLAVGALAGQGHFSLWAALLLAAAASLVSDSIWYWLGRRRGASILNLLCRISLEPDSCVTRTKGIFGRYGGRALLFAKFLPGFSTAAPPMAGMTAMPFRHFLLADGTGSLLWVAVFLAAGFLFSAQLEQAAEQAARLGSGLGVLLGLALAAYIAWQIWQRQKFLREMRMARITPEELHQRMTAGEEVTIIDLRRAAEVADRMPILPGAIHLDPADLEERHEVIPRDRDVILYCT